MSQISYPRSAVAIERIKGFSTDARDPDSLFPALPAEDYQPTPLECELLDINRRLAVAVQGLTHRVATLEEAGPRAVARISRRRKAVQS